MKQITCITPTGDRIESFRMTRKCMEAQTVQPDQWLVIDDGHIPLPEELKQGLDYVRRIPLVDEGHTLSKNMRKVLPYIKGDSILIIEDDDWYGPRYIETMRNHLQKYDLVGEGYARYYHVPAQKYSRLPNEKHASFSQTGFNRSLLPALEKVLERNSYIDTRLWSDNAKKKSFLFYDQADELRIHCSLKGLPGRHGMGVGHKIGWGHYKSDREYSVLRKWIGAKNVQSYIDCCTKTEVGKMNYGDEIMALGRAEVVYNILGKPVAVYGVSGNPRRNPVWNNHPAVNADSPLHIVDGPQVRPYMLRWKHPGPVSVWNPKYRARAGHMRLTAQEQADALCLIPEKPFVLVEPLVRAKSSQNKDWGWSRWEELVKDFPIPVYQFDIDGETKILPGVTAIDSPSFRVAAGVMEHASLVITIDGGTHHMAASMGTPAVVIFGGFADPKITGYAYQKNFYIADLPESPCGRYDECPHCKKAMSMISTEEVKKAALEILGGEANGS